MNNDIKKDYCFAGMLTPSWCGKSRALDMSYFVAQVMPKFTENFGIPLLKSGQIENLKFAGTEMNQHSGKT